jgi:hypothetical protein
MESKAADTMETSQFNQSTADGDVVHANKRVSRLVLAMALFDQYSKTCDPGMKARTPRSVNAGTTIEGEGGSSAKRSAKDNKMLGSWEQRQILKHAGLDDEVSERMAAKALETAAAHVAAAAQQQRLAGKQHHAAPGVFDRRLHLAWIHALARKTLKQSYQHAYQRFSQCCRGLVAQACVRARWQETL